MRSTYSTLIMLCMCFIWTSCSKRFVNPIEDVYNALIERSNPEFVLAEQEPLIISYASRRRSVDIQNDIKATQKPNNDNINEPYNKYRKRRKKEKKLAATSTINRTIENGSTQEMNEDNAINGFGLEPALVICGTVENPKLCPCESDNDEYFFITSAGTGQLPASLPDLTDNDKIALFTKIVITVNGQQPKDLPIRTIFFNNIPYNAFVFDGDQFSEQFVGEIKFFYRTLGQQNKSDSFSIEYNRSLSDHDALRITPK